MTTLQNYLQSLYQKGDISKAEFEQMRHTNVKPTRVHDWPKIHKRFHNIPKFIPLIDTTEMRVII